MKAIKHLRAAILHNDKLLDKIFSSEAFLLNKVHDPSTMILVATTKVLGYLA